MSARDALRRYYERLAREQSSKSRYPRKNGKPEQEVQRHVIAWLKANAFSADVVESKATFSRRAGRYLHSQARPGFSDVAGSCPNGIALFLELKAPGRLATLRPSQREFLIEKINVGAFGAVIDSVKLLERLWIEFEHRRKKDPHLSRILLLSQLEIPNKVFRSRMFTKVKLKGD